MSPYMKDGYYYCSKHNDQLQWCENKITGEFFLRCPEDYNCPKISNISEKEVFKHEWYAPNYEQNMADWLRDKIEDDD